ncbi:MAG: hypothetical protein ABI766_10190 [Gemmatimonadales bacterium]
MHPRPRSHPALALLLPLTLIVGAAAYTPTSRLAPVAGTMSLVGTPNNSPEKGPGGALVFIGVSKGTNVSTGTPAFMDGADVVSADTTSLVNGNGTHHGVLTMTKGADKVSFKWSGEVTSTMSQDQKPAISYHGSWTAVAGATGGGTYEGHFTSPVASVTNWKGELGK